tara:strand:- start:341 stop:715 length:375 start_codon:yes stop_codon:yes gene_type:complete
MSDPIKDMNGNWARLFKLLLGSYIPLIMIVCGAQAYFFNTIGSIRTDVSLNAVTTDYVKESLIDIKLSVKEIEGDIEGVRSKVITLPILKEEFAVMRQKTNDVSDFINQLEYELKQHTESHLNQ